MYMFRTILCSPNGTVDLGQAAAVYRYTSDVYGAGPLPECSINVFECVVLECVASRIVALVGVMVSACAYSTNATTREPNGSACTSAFDDNPARSL